MAERVPGRAPAEFIAHFAVLRRAGRPTDAIPRQRNPALGLSLSRYYPGETRLLARLPNKARLYILVGFSRPEPGDCRAWPIFCLVELDPGPTQIYNGHCARLGVVGDGSELLFQVAISPPLEALIPDGVASVRLVYPDGETVEAKVTRNLLLYSPPRALRRKILARERQLERRAMRMLANPHLTPARRRAVLLALDRQGIRLDERLDPRREQWLDDAGRVVRTIRPNLTSVSIGGDSFFGGSTAIVPAPHR